jgi:hypothetical protein
MHFLKIQNSDKNVRRKLSKFFSLQNAVQFLETDFEEQKGGILMDRTGNGEIEGGGEY